MSVLLDNECFPTVPGVETEILMPKMTLKTLPNRGKRFFPAHPASPPDYRSLSADRNLFRGEGIANVQNPIFALALFCLRRNPYFEAVLRDSQSSRPDADTAGPSPTVACAPNVTQRLAKLKGINDSSNQSHPDRERADRSLI